MATSIDESIQTLRQKGKEDYDNQYYNKARAKFELALQEMKKMEKNTSQLMELQYDIVYHLADIYMILEQYSKAYDYTDMAIKIATDLLDQTRYAEALDKQGEIKQKSNASEEEVLSILNHSLAIKLETTGCDQMKIARSYDLIGITLTKSGKHDLALAMFQRGMNVRTAIVGHEHPDVGDSYLYVADVCYIIGRFLDSDSMYRSAIGIYIQSLPETHAKIIAAYDGIVKARIKMKKFDDAIEMKEIADKLRRKAEQNIRCQTPSASSSPSDTDKIVDIQDHNVSGCGAPIPLLSQKNGGIIIHPKAGEIAGIFDTTYFKTYWSSLSEGHCTTDCMRMMLLGPQHAGKSFIANLLCREDIMNVIISTSSGKSSSETVNLMGYYICTDVLKIPFRPNAEQKSLIGIQLISQNSAMDGRYRARVDKARALNPELRTEEYPTWDPDNLEQYREREEDVEKHLGLQRKVNNFQQRYVNVWRFGWRAHHYFTHAPFMPSNGIYVLVFNLGQDLDEEVQTKDGYPTTTTHRSIMREWIISIVDSYPLRNRINIKINLTHHQLTLPIILLVASHTDCIDNKDLRNHHFKQFKSDLLSLVPSSYHQHIYSTGVVFNCNPDDTSHAAFQDRRQSCRQLHSLVSTIANSLHFVTNPIPIRSYLSKTIISTTVKGQSIRSSTVSQRNREVLSKIRKVMTLKEVKVVTDEFELFLTIEDLVNALMFMHDIGIIIFCADSGNEAIIITMVDWFIHILDAIVQLDPKHVQDLTIRRSFYTAHQTGILEENCIQSIMTRFQVEPEEKVLILKYMELNDIMCKMTDVADSDSSQIRYFAPFVLDVQAHDFNLTPYRVSEWLYIGYDQKDIGCLVDGMFHLFLTAVVKEWRNNIQVELRDGCAKFCLLDDQYWILMKKEDCHIGLCYLDDNSKYDDTSTELSDKIKAVIASKRPHHFLKHKLSSLAKQKVAKFVQFQSQFYIKCTFCHKFMYLSDDNTQQQTGSSIKCGHCHMQYDYQSLQDWNLCNYKCCKNDQD